jgi:hypothetical protein
VLQIEFDESKAGQWMLISRNPDGLRLEIDTPPQFIWHYASAAEDPVTGDATHRLSSVPLQPGTTNANQMHVITAVDQWRHTV